MNKIPLLHLHEKNAKELGEFAGWRTIITFTSLREEHEAVRRDSGIFDISHMTRTKISGPDATQLLQKILTIDVERLKPGRMKYGLILNMDGGIIDDVTVYKVADNSYLMVSNALTRNRVLEWLEHNIEGEVLVEDITESSAFFAVQGPKSSAYVSNLVGDVSGFKWFEGGFRNMGDCRLLVTRSGYTGGDGYELMVLCGIQELYEKVWKFFTDQGVKPCGLACRDVCRIEAGFPLYGQDFDEKNDPIEAGLFWAVKMDKRFFIGKESLEKKQANGPVKRLMLVEMVEPGVPRPGYKVYVGDVEAGKVTSGCLSPTINKGIALAYLPPSIHVDGAEVFVDVRGRRRKAVVRTKPLISLSRP
ncbi:MAG: glycine cleavage system aminomethyltransferase GcvT [Candidatus Caldarchaeum sp.]